MTDVIEILQELIRCPSVTPEDAGAQEYLAGLLKDMGFECHLLPFGSEPAVPNLFARMGGGGPHLCYAGHTDVVPPGNEAAWTHGPFNPVIDNGRIYGRGTWDMKGSVAAFTAAVILYLEKHGRPKKGSISLLITGDEEGPAVNGTVKVLEWMEAKGHKPDVCLVGEPTNLHHLGQEIKIGRRGSLSGSLTVKGKQGHVAYQHLADNPLPRLVKLLDALGSYKFDSGSEFFPPTNLEITSIDVGNRADNVIPALGTARFNIRFNDQWLPQQIEDKIRSILDKAGADYELNMASTNAESFLTKPGQWSDMVKTAVKEVTGLTPAYTTNGGTSDARFIARYCPVVECGGVNETVHQIDENAEIAVLEGLVKIYLRVLELYFLQ